MNGSIHSLWNDCRILSNSGCEFLEMLSLIKNYIFSSTQRLFLHCWQMTTNLASLLWMVTEHFLAHCKATRERFYTNSLLICRRNTVRKIIFVHSIFIVVVTPWCWTACYSRAYFLNLYLKSYTNHSDDASIYISSFRCMQVLATIFLINLTYSVS